MTIAPWRIGDYAGTGIARPAMDHLGFTVESVGAFQADLARIAAANTALVGHPLGGTRENAQRHALLRRGARGAFQMTDPDGVLLDISEGP
jgi:hypothetical protein